VGGGGGGGARGARRAFILPGKFSARRKKQERRSKSLGFRVGARRKKQKKGEGRGKREGGKDEYSGQDGDQGHSEFQP